MWIFFRFFFFFVFLILNKNYIWNFYYFKKLYCFETKFYFVFFCWKNYDFKKKNWNKKTHEQIVFFKFYFSTVVLMKMINLIGINLIGIFMDVWTFDLDSSFLGVFFMDVIIFRWSREIIFLEKKLILDFKKGTISFKNIQNAK